MFAAKWRSATWVVHSRIRASCIFIEWVHVFCNSCSYPHTSQSSAQGHIDDNYAWPQAELLFPHEALRQEMLRIERVLQHLNLVDSPWHMKVLHTFLDEYFFRAVHFHHNNEEKIQGPCYEKLGEKVDFGKTADHKTLLAMMDSFGSDVNATFDLVSAAQADKTTDPALLREKEANLRSSWSAFQDLMFVHLQEEEEFWPPVFERHGRAHAKALVEQILKAEFSLKGKDAVAGNAFAGAVMDSVGPLRSRYASYKYSPAHALNMGPWASVQPGEAFMNDIPFIPRALVLPAFHKTYILKWRAMIESIGGTVNPLTAK